VKGFDYYVNEAFGASHRAHASIMIPPTLLPSAAGSNLTREVQTLLSLLESPERPFVAVTGGAKVKDKLGIMKVLAAKADLVIVGGGMAYTFAAAEGRTVGGSLFDASFVEQCASLLEGGNVVIPVDARGLANGSSFGPEVGPTRRSVLMKHSRRFMGLGHRSQLGRDLRRGTGERAHDSLEWADGCL